MVARRGLADVEAAARAALATVGFRKSGEIFTLDLKPGVLGRLGLPLARWQGEVTLINPFIGVHHVELERELSALIGGKYLRSEVSLGCGLGYVMPQASFVPFLFSDEATAHQAVWDITEATKDFGIPFMRSYETLPAVVASLPDWPHAVSWVRGARLSVGLALLGKEADAQREVDALAQFAARTAPAEGAHVNEFLAAFRERFGIEGRDSGEGDKPRAGSLN